MAIRADHPRDALGRYLPRKRKPICHDCLARERARQHRSDSLWTALFMALLFALVCSAVYFGWAGV